MAHIDAARRRGRRTPLLVVAVCVFASLCGPANLSAQAPGPCALAQLRLRCPDLVMAAPFDLHLDRTSVRGHVLLRAASSLSNLGRGPLELVAHRNGTGAWSVAQEIYDASGSRYVFTTEGQLVFKFVPEYRYGQPPIGNYSYWKFRHVASFELWSVDARLHLVRLVRGGPKVDYCLRDLIRAHPSTRSPIKPVYPACSQNRELRTDTLGISVGWSDVYPYEYPQQWIDVSSLRGRFAFVMVANPLGLLNEANEQNNASETFVQLPSGRVLGHRVGVAAP